MVAADFNQDGYTDLAVANYNDNFSPSHPATLTLLLGNGDGAFTLARRRQPVGQLPNDLMAADFNGDGTTDLAIPNSADFNTTILLIRIHANGNRKCLMISRCRHRHPPRGRRLCGEYFLRHQHLYHRPARAHHCDHT